MDLAVTPGDWDMQDAFDPRNVISLMSGPLAATGVPGGGRTSVSDLAAETYPTPLFLRTSFGGRFGTMLKLAGWPTIKTLEKQGMKKVADTLTKKDILGA